MQTENSFQVVNVHGVPLVGVELKATDNVLAMTHPADPVEQHSRIGKMYALRVAGTMDISIALCTLLAIQRLQ